MDWWTGGLVNESCAQSNRQGQCRLCEMRLHHGRRFSAIVSLRTSPNLSLPQLSPRAMCIVMSQRGICVFVQTFYKGCRLRVFWMFADMRSRYQQHSILESVHPSAACVRCGFDDGRCRRDDSAQEVGGWCQPWFGATSPPRFGLSSCRHFRLQTTCHHDSSSHNTIAVLQHDSIASAPPKCK